MACRDLRHNDYSRLYTYLPQAFLLVRNPSSFPEVLSAHIMANLAQGASYHCLRQPQHRQAQPDVSGLPNTYKLRRYSWRAFLGITGPLSLLGFYAFISFHYLNERPLNDIVGSHPGDARWAFYAWFIISIFALEWACSALSNVQAVALMRPSFAPKSAMHFMWHGDESWANPLWWLRATRNFVLGMCLKFSFGDKSRYTNSRPGGL